MGRGIIGAIDPHRSRRKHSERHHRHGARSSACLARPVPAVTASLPTVGDVYMVNTVIFTNGDHAPVRPCVIVRSPHHPLDYVTFIQRSTTPGNRPGIDHPKGLLPGLDVDGRWVLAYERSVRHDTFAASASGVVGQLSDTYLQPLLEAWENQ